MFCLRSWVPLLFIPTNASPIFVLTFFLLTYYLNRPCIYCSILLAVLFASSCYWSESCWFDASIASTITDGVASKGYNWFEPRYISSTIPNPLPAAAGPGRAGEDMSFLMGVVDSTISGLGSVAVQSVQNSGIGLAWARRLVGGEEWRVPWLDIDVKL